MTLLNWLAVFALPVVLGACAALPRAPNLDSIYGRAAEIQGPERRPLVSVPGTLGSRLVDRTSGNAIWGGEFALSADPSDPANFRLLALPIGQIDDAHHRLRDNVRPDGILKTAYASVLGVPVEVTVYSGVLRTLQSGGWYPHEDPYLDVGAAQTRFAPLPDPRANSFPFAYDWRRDLVDAVKRLDAHIRAKAEQVAILRAGAPGVGPDQVRFDILSHSMGTLITRYYLMYGVQDLPEDGSLPVLNWAGAKWIGKAVLVAPPNAGSVTAFENLVNGRSLGPLQAFNRPALLGSHFSVYALMPRNRHKRLRWGDTDEPLENLYDPALWERMNWGLADPDEADALAILMPDELDAERRRARALSFQAEALRRAEQFHRALDRPVDVLPEGLDIHLVVGGGYETPASAVIDRDSGDVTIDRVEEGDGVVLRASSLLDERQGGSYQYGLVTPLRYTSVLFLPEEHVALTQSPVFGDNLLFWLIEGQRSADDLRRSPLGLPRGRPTPVDDRLRDINDK